MTTATSPLRNIPGIPFPFTPSRNRESIPRAIAKDQDEWLEIIPSSWKFERDTFRNFPEVVEIVNRLVVFSEQNLEKHCETLGENREALGAYDYLIQILQKESTHDYSVNRVSDFILRNIEQTALPPLPKAPQPQVSFPTRVADTKDELKQWFRNLTK